MRPLSSIFLDVTFILHVCHDSLAGQAAWIISIAPDTIKSRIQTSLEPMGIVATARSIIKAHGVRGLFAGEWHV